MIVNISWLKLLACLLYEWCFLCCWLFILFSYSHNNESWVCISRNHVFNIFRLLLAQYSPVYTDTIVMLTKLSQHPLKVLYTHNKVNAHVHGLTYINIYKQTCFCSSAVGSVVQCMRKGVWLAFKTCQIWFSERSHIFLQSSSSLSSDLVIYCNRISTGNITGLTKCFTAIKCCFRCMCTGLYIEVLQGKIWTKTKGLVNKSIHLYLHGMLVTMWSS